MSEDFFGGVGIIDWLVTISQGASLVVPLLCSGLVLIACKAKGWLAWLDRPIDRGAKLGGKPLFGRNKTYRGLVVHLGVVVLATSVLHVAAQGNQWLSTIYANEPIVLGLSSATGYLVGELVNSFVKRRLNIGAGEHGSKLQAFFDNTDGMFGSGIVVISYGVALPVIAASVVVSIAVHEATDVLMRRLRLKQNHK